MWTWVEENQQTCWTLGEKCFDEWRQFRGFDMTKLISNHFEGEGLVKNLVDMLSIFVLQVAKKMAPFILQPSTHPNLHLFF